MWFAGSQLERGNNKFAGGGNPSAVWIPSKTSPTDKSGKTLKTAKMAQKMYISEATLRNSAAQTKKINLADKA